MVELSPANRQFAIVGGLVLGIALTALVALIIRWQLRNAMVTFVISACVALIVPALILYIITAMIAAA